MRLTFMPGSRSQIYPSVLLKRPMKAPVSTTGRNRATRRTPKRVPKPKTAANINNAHAKN
jgi:hypothetical protein